MKISSSGFKLGVNGITIQFGDNGDNSRIFNGCDVGVTLRFDLRETLAFSAATAKISLCGVVEADHGASASPQT